MTAQPDIPKNGADGSDVELAELVDGMAAQERRVLEVIIPNRLQAMPIVAAAGLEMRHFAQDDHRLIFAGWQLACEKNLTLVRQLSLTRRALIADGFWDPSAIPDENGMRYSDARLARLGIGRMSDEELEDIVKNGPGDGLLRAIARQVTALVDASDAFAGWRP